MCSLLFCLQLSKSEPTPSVCSVFLALLSLVLSPDVHSMEGWNSCQQSKSETNIAFWMLLIPLLDGVCCVCYCSALLFFAAVQSLLLQNIVLWCSELETESLMYPCFWPVHDACPISIPNFWSSVPARIPEPLCLLHMYFLTSWSTRIWNSHLFLLLRIQCLGQLSQISQDIFSIS